MSKLRAIICFLLCFAGFAAEGQDLPTLGRSSQIVSGSFPNGVSYYLISNGVSKGYANFALVQKGVADKDEVRSGLDALPHFGSRVPYRFLASLGVGYGPEGFISYSGDAAIYNFADVPTSNSSSVDSTMVMMLDLVSRFPGEQAIVVAGDIDAAKFKERLYMLSLTVPGRIKVGDGREYEWSPKPGPKLIHYGNRTAHLAEITASYASPRTPRKYMSTPQPLVSQMYAHQFGYILRKRTEDALAKAGIPLGYTSFDYLDSSRTPYDEKYIFRIGVDEKDVTEAAALLSSVLCSLDSEGASEQEYADAKSRLQAYTVGLVRSAIPNADYVRECVANYLYGSNLPDPKAAYDFFRGRKIAADRDLELFNRFVSALLDPQRNLTLGFSTPSDTLDVNAVSEVFRSAWKCDPDEKDPYRLRAADTLGLYYPMGKKLKLKGETVEPLSGGKFWTFSNGMKVVFRKSDDAQIRYALMIRGGYTEVPGIEAGESAFVGDMLSLYDVCGMGARQFRGMLEANGISMDCKVSIADMRIQGTAIPGKLGLVLRSILSIQKNRTLNMENFHYYKACEALRQEAFRLSTEGVNAVTDSIMCPDFFYPVTKSVERLDDDLPGKADAYFDARFAKNDDGLLYIEGNMDAEALLKMLCKTLGAFKTGGQASVRPKVDYQLRSGWSTYTVDRNTSTIGDGGYSTNIALSALRPFTMPSWCAFRIAVESLRAFLTDELAPLGQHIEIVPQLQLLPVERVTVFINCSPCPWEGLPAGVDAEEPLVVLGALRDALAKLPSVPVSQDELARLKASLASEMSSECADSGFIMDACLRRYSEGKDMVSNYKAFIDKVSADDVAAVLSDLESGSKVEYVIK